MGRRRTAVHQGRRYSVTDIEAYEAAQRRHITGDGAAITALRHSNPQLKTNLIR